jgi:hypothetical protein
VANLLAYLGSPYSRYEKGLVAAFQDVARIAARLRTAGIFTYCPIVHCHPLAVYGDLDPVDLNLWYPHNHVMMERCDCLIVAHMDGWDTSDGVKSEIEYFKKMDKPIFDMDCESLVLVKRRTDSHFDARMQLGIKDMPSYRGTLGPLAMPDSKGQ